MRLNIAVSIGLLDLFSLYAHGMLRAVYPLAIIALAMTWVFALVGLGVAARHGHRWAFWAGIVLYGADMIALILTFSIWAFGVHAFFVSAGC